MKDYDPKGVKFNDSWIAALRPANYSSAIPMYVRDVNSKGITLTRQQEKAKPFDTKGAAKNTATMAIQAWKKGNQ